MRTRSAGKRLTRSRCSPAASDAVKLSPKPKQPRRGFNSMASAKATLSNKRGLRSSVQAKVNRPHSQNEKPSTNTKKQTVLPPASRDKTQIKSTNRVSKPTTAKSKRKKAKAQSEDPYELSGDEDKLSTAPVESLSASLITSTTVDKSRKFFSTRGEGLAKRTTLSAFELLRQKLTTNSRGSRRMAAVTNRTALSRVAPMSQGERARIAATTIWLPIPHQRCASTPTARQIHRLPHQLQSVSPPEAKGSILTGNPVVQPSDPSISALRTAGLSRVSLESTEVLARRSDAAEVAPLADVSNLPSCSLPTSFCLEGDKASSELHLISFAQPLSPIRKRSSVSRGSSSLSPSAPRPSLPTRSRNEDASKYREWLEIFNSQLKPYEDFNLTID